MHIINFSSTMALMFPTYSDYVSTKGAMVRYYCYLEQGSPLASNK